MKAGVIARSIAVPDDVFYVAPPFWLIISPYTH
jgi:hypothetical protein